MMTAKQQLDGFLDCYEPAIAKLTRAALKKMRARFPGALELVYDNYNALGVGFAPTEKAGDVIFSVVPYPRWVTLFFFTAAKIDDPAKLLRGTGKVVRSVILKDASDLDTPALRALMDAALGAAKLPLDPKQKSRIVIKSISEKQRPRRPR